MNCAAVSIMRIRLVYNAGAGDAISEDTLRAAIERAGHELVDDDPELVVAAGGDGTVARVARELAGRGVPIAVLPLGTANNIARSLGIEGAIDDLIARWGTGARRPIDVGVVRDRNGRRRFVEAVGSGLVTAGIATMDRVAAERADDPRAQLARALRCYRAVLAGLAPRRWTLTLDGAPLVGDFLLVEVLNIRSIGANLELATEADASDGVFHVVTAGPEHRDAIDRYLEARAEGPGDRLALPTRVARRVVVDGWDELHVDDEVTTGASLGRVEITIEPGALALVG